MAEQSWLVVRLADPSELRRSRPPERAFVVPMAPHGPADHAQALEHITEAGTYLVQPCPTGPSEQVAYRCRKFELELALREVTADDAPAAGNPPPEGRRAGETMAQANARAEAEREGRR